MTTPGTILHETELEKSARAGDMDAEKAQAILDAPPTEPGHPHADGTVKRNLKSRHLTMIALGGTIGTGLFVGSGTALATGGPCGILLGYTIMGLIVYAMMVALGEMSTMYPSSGGFTHFAARFIDPAAGFAIGWNYWYCSITMPVELTAAAIVVGYWNSEINTAAWIAPLFVAIIAINFLGVKWYGEMEFIFSGIKILTIVGLIIFGICITAGASPNGQGPIGFRYWHNPGAFQQYTKGDVVVGGAWGRFIAFWAVLVQAAFSFIGTEIVAVTVGEAENPRKNVPKAIRSVFWRIILFYTLGMLVIGMLVSADDPSLLTGDSTASTSPFVIAIKNAGVNGLPSVINAVLLIAAWSAGNSVSYAASRVLYALALDNKAPRVFRKCSKGGVPYLCVGFTLMFGFLGFLSCGNTTAAEIFAWLYNISSITGLITWAVILTSYLRFYYGLKAQNRSRDDLPYRAPFQPYFSWFGLCGVCVIIFFNGFGSFVARPFNYSGFLSSYICLPIFFCLYGGYKCFGGDRHGKTGWFVWAPTALVSLDEIDFDGGCREMDEMEAREQLKDQRPKNPLSRVLDYIF